VSLRAGIVTDQRVTKEKLQRDPSVPLRGDISPFSKAKIGRVAAI